MTDHIQANVVHFYSNLETFRVAAKYTDLTIECEDSYFHCHRLTLAAASRFFDSMFAGTFKERKEESLLIREVNTTTLGEVLRFIYTGDVTVTCVNVCNLFKASQIFELTGIADLCLKFIKSNKMTVNSTLEMYSLVCQNKNEKLIQILSQDIASQFKVFARASMFLEIPFDNFKIILDKLSLSTENEEALLGAICRWLLHSRKERLVNFYQLYKMIRFTSVSSEVTKFVNLKLFMDPDAVELSVETVDPVGYDEFTAMPRTTHGSFLYKKLHLFTRSAESNSMKIFSIDRKLNCTNSGEVYLKDDLPHGIRTIVLNNYLYCLHYSRRASEKENNQTFLMYTSVDMRSLMELNNPPIIFGDVKLCRERNNIYAYNQTLFQPLMKTDSRCSVMFSEEEMNRGIYSYNVDLDIWLPVPAMKNKVEDACMTTRDGSLYLIGGTSDPVNSTSARFVQTYDCREGAWRVLSSTDYDRVGADCCSFIDGMIYVCGGRDQTTSVERYDPKREKWEVLEKKMNSEMQYHRLISFTRKLWAVGNFIPGSTSVNNNSSIQNYPNEIISKVMCQGCTSSEFNHKEYVISYHGYQDKHYEHEIESASHDNWVEIDYYLTRQNPISILDGVVF